MSDSDPDTKKAGVPSWQLKPKDDTLKAEVKEVKDDNSIPSRETVIQQAKKFLEEDEVRNSSTDKKIAFLEGKGLRREEIEGLLSITRNLEASSTSSSTVHPPQSQPTKPSS
jgi:Pex14 N-terminal domain